MPEPLPASPEISVEDPKSPDGRRITPLAFQLLAISALILSVTVAGVAIHVYFHDSPSRVAATTPETASAEQPAQAIPTNATPDSKDEPQAKKYDMENDPDHPAWACFTKKIEPKTITLSSWSPIIFVENKSDYDARNISVAWQAIDQAGVLTQQGAFQFESIPPHATASANGGLLLQGNMTLKLGSPQLEFGP